MRLIGSKQEQEFRDELKKSKISLLQNNNITSLRSLLITSFNDLKTVYIINWIPEQGEDIYTLLINLDIIAKVEISRINKDEEPILKIIKLKDFEKGLNKISQIKLAVAIDLAKKEIEGNQVAEWRD